MWQTVDGFLRQIHFQYPLWMWSWPLVSLAVAYLLYGHRLRPLTRVPDLHASDTYRHPRMKILRRLHARAVEQQLAHGLFRRWAVYAVLLWCLFVALAQPYRLGARVPPPPQYRDTVFIIDTSISMELRDYLAGNKRVDRMTILKSVLTHFIEQLKGNRIGLIVFSEHAYTLVPLTADYALLKTEVRRLQPAVLTGRTSNPGLALLYTLHRLQQTGLARQAHKPVLVLISDVDRANRNVDPRAVAAYLHEQGYRLHTIAIGASSYAARQKRVAGLLYQPANFALLQAIARRGGGRFYWANNVTSLGAAIRSIQSVERRPERAEPRHVTISLYQWPLLAGLLWIMAVQLWSGTRKRP